MTNAGIRLASLSATAILPTRFQSPHTEPVHGFEVQIGLRLGLHPS